MNSNGTEPYMSGFLGIHLLGQGDHQMLRDFEKLGMTNKRRTIASDAVPFFHMRNTLPDFPHLPHGAIA
ncbi:hypothetical protein D3C85_1913740 [compost metagenome]